MLALPNYSPPPRLLAFGAALLDEVAEVSEEFLAALPGRKGGSQPISAAEREGLRRLLAGRCQRSLGGAAGNTARAFAALGGQAGMLSLVGADESGRFYRQAMQDSAVALPGIKVIPIGETGSCLSLVTPDGERTMRPCLGVANHFQAKYFTLADFQPYSHFYVEGYILYTPEIAEEILSLAQTAGLTICYDAGSPELVGKHRELLRYLLKKYVSVAFFNEREAAAFAGLEDPRQALQELAQLCALAVVKGGGQGAWIARGQEQIHIPAQSAQLVDSTGAGDFWAAGFLYAWLNGRSLSAAGRLAAAVSAAVVARPGANLPANIWQQLRQFLTEL